MASSIWRCLIRHCFFCIGQSNSSSSSSSDDDDSEERQQIIPTGTTDSAIVTDATTTTTTTTTSRRRGGRGRRQQQRQQVSSRNRGREHHQYQLTATNSQDNDEDEDIVSGEENVDIDENRSPSGTVNNEHGEIADRPTEMITNPETPVPSLMTPSRNRRNRRETTGEEEEKEEEQMLLEENSTTFAPINNNSTSSRLGDFWNRVRTRLHQFENRTVIKKQQPSTTTSTSTSRNNRATAAATPTTIHDETDEDNDLSDGTIDRMGSTTTTMTMMMPTPMAPLLKEATSFRMGHCDGNENDATASIPTIASDQVVLPGSELQRAMAEKASSYFTKNDNKNSNNMDFKNVEEDEDECVICMEGFDPSNPRMPTLCGCGENKTYFHLPCLYQWIEQSNNCPSCRMKLQWQEF